MSGTLQASVIKDEASATNNLTLNTSGGVTVGQNLTVTGTSTFTGSLGNVTTGTISSGNITSSGTVADATGTLRPLVSGTAVASTSGTSIDFTSIPSWVKRVTVLLQGVSTSTATNPPLAFQLGTSGGLVSSGYLGASSSISGAASVNSLIAFSTNFQFIQPSSIANIAHGRVVFENITGNTWVATGQIAQSDATRVSWFSGAIVLSGALTQVRITTVSGTDTFDAGSINILYE